MRNSLLLLLAAGLLASCGQGKRATVTGTFSGLSNDTLRLERVNTQGRVVVDSAITNDKGDFRFVVKLDGKTPAFYDITHAKCVVPLLLSPGERVSVNSLGDLNRNYTVSGSPESETLREFVSLYRSGVATMDSLSGLYAQTRPGQQYDERRKELLRAYTQAYVKFKRSHIEFIVRNANSMAALYSLYQRLPNDEPIFSASNDYIYYNMVSDSLSSRYPNSPHVMALQQDVAKQQQTRELAQRIGESIENQTQNYPEIDLRDMYDKQQLLSSLNGKVILVDFWTVTEQRHMVLNAEYKELYEKYHPRGLEIYQVSLGDNRAAWITSVQQQRLPWISVLDSNGLAGSAAMAYNVTGVPANILIDKQGNIVGRNYQDAALKAKVAELTSR